MRVWLAYRIIQTEGVTAADFPELEPEAVIATTPAALLLDLLGTRGHTNTFQSGDPDLTDFILDAERALASPQSDATAPSDVKK
jgi:hypothetical protein